MYLKKRYSEIRHTVVKTMTTVNDRMGRPGNVFLLQWEREKKRDAKKRLRLFNLYPFTYARVYDFFYCTSFCCFLKSLIQTHNIHLIPFWFSNNEHRQLNKTNRQTEIIYRIISGVEIILCLGFSYLTVDFIVIENDDMKIGVTIGGFK